MYVNFINVRFYKTFNGNFINAHGFCQKTTEKSQLNLFDMPPVGFEARTHYSNRPRLYILHTYIGYYNTISRIITLLLTPLILRVLIFVHEWLDLQFKVDSELRIFQQLFMGILFTLKVFVRNLLRVSHRRKILLYFILLEMFDMEFDFNPAESF